MKKETEAEREARWQAERDYGLLIDYQELIKDSKRIEAAKKLAKVKQSEILNILKINKKEG